MPRKVYDWDVVRDAFVHDPRRRQLAEFCREEKVCYNTAKHKSARENWFEARDIYWSRVEGVAEDKLVEKVGADLADFRAEQLKEARDMVAIARNGIMDRIEANGGKVPHDMPWSDLRLLWVSGLDVMRKAVGLPDEIRHTNVDVTKLSDEQLERLVKGEDPKSVLQ